MTKYTIDELTLVGSIAVDSGQAMVGDPCYLDGWNTNEGDEWNLEGKIGDYSYHGASATTLATNAGELGIGKAIVFNTGYGDGYYPVYIQLNDDGRVSKVVIDFEGELDKEQN
jgi:hypothetical protein